MRATDTKTKKTSEPDAVDAYIQGLSGSLADLTRALRAVILSADPAIGEEIKWNAPAFFYTGPMADFDPKEYRRHLVIFNFRGKDCVRLVFLRGDRANDKSGLLEGDYADGRRIATFKSEADVRSKKKALVAALKAQLKHIKE